MTRCYNTEDWASIDASQSVAFSPRSQTNRMDRGSRDSSTLHITSRGLGNKLRRLTWTGEVQN